MTSSGLSARFYGMPLDEAETWIAGYAAHFSRMGLVRKTVVDASQPLAAFEPPDPMAVGRPSDAEVRSIFGDVSSLRGAGADNEIIAEMSGQMEKLLGQLTSGTPPPELVIRAIEPTEGSNCTLVEMSYGEDNLDFDAIGLISGAPSYRFVESFDNGNLLQRFFTIRNAGEVVRSVGLTREGRSLSFFADGDVQKWEDTAAYEAGATEERLHQELFHRYLFALGLDPKALQNRKFSRIREYRETVESPKSLDTKSTYLEFRKLFESTLTSE